MRDGLLFAPLYEDINPCLPGPFEVISFSSFLLSPRGRQFGGKENKRKENLHYFIFP